jgi:hypothetical protein
MGGDGSTKGNAAASGGRVPFSVLACLGLGQRRDQYLAEQLEAALQVRVWAVFTGEGLGEELELVVTEWANLRMVAPC